MNSKEKGNIGEAKTLLEFIKRGIPVAIPYGDNQRYDLIADFNGKLNRIQIKVCNFEENGAIKCMARSSTNHTTNKKLSTYENDIDYFVFYNQTRDILALVSIDEVGSQKTLNLRVEPSNSTNQHTSRFFNDYSFDRILCVETLHGGPKSE